MYFLWTRHIETTQLSFEVISPNVMIKLSENWELSKSFKLTDLFINNLDIVLAPDIDIKFSRIIDGNVNMDQESATLEMNGSSIWLKELNVPKDTLLDLELNKDRLSLYSKGKPLAGKINAENAKLVLLTEEEDEEDEEISKTIQDFETISFTSSETDADPVKLKFKFSDLPWEIQNFRAQSIKFVKEFPPGSGKFESTIQSAKVKLIETGAELKLRENDFLKIEIITTRRLECSQSKDGIKVFFEGSVRAISAGSRGYEKNIAPTYLEYAYHYEKFGYFWGAVGFLWCLFWSLKNIFWGNSLSR